MKEITPKGVRRGRACKSRSWTSVIESYRKSINAHPGQYDPMLHLVETLASSPVANELFPQTSMSTLLIADEEHFHQNDNLLRITYVPTKRQFEFEHRTLSKKDDQTTCTEEEALKTLSLFLKYKFGVLFYPNLDTSSKNKTD